MNISIELSQKQIVTQYMIQYMNLLQMNHSGKFLRKAIFGKSGHRV